jgi:hypothetical protein
VDGEPVEGGRDVHGVADARDLPVDLNKLHDKWITRSSTPPTGSRTARSSSLATDTNSQRFDASSGKRERKIRTTRTQRKQSHRRDREERMKKEILSRVISCFYF